MIGDTLHLYDWLSHNMISVKNLMKNEWFILQTIYDIQQLLKKYGIYVYTGERYGDIVLLEM